MVRSSCGTAPDADRATRVHGEILPAIEAGQPVARSALRGALPAVSHAIGTVPVPHVVKTVELILRAILPGATDRPTAGLA